MAAWAVLQFGASVFESRAGRETAEQLRHAMDATGDHRGGEVVGAGDDVGDDLGFGGIRNGWLEDADDGGGARVAEGTDFAEYGWVALQDGGPETVGQDHGAGGGRAVVARVEEAAENGMEAHHFEVRCRLLRRRGFRAARPDRPMSEADGRESPNARWI